MIIDATMLDEIRLAKGLMKSELHKKARISFATLIRAYDGHVVSWRTLRAIAAALDVKNPLRLLRSNEPAPELARATA